MATIKSSSNGSPGRNKNVLLSHMKYEHLLAGISGGVTSTLILHPLDLIKIRFAVNDGRTATIPQYRGLTSAFTTIIRQEGLRGLYKGVTPNVWGSGSAWGLYFMFYNTIKTYVQEGNTTVPLGPAKHMLAAAEAGILTLVLTNPIWVVKTRLCLQFSNETTSDNKRYKGMVDGLVKIYRNEGVRGWYRGFVPGMFGVSHGALQFMVYEEMKNHYNEYRKLPIDTKMSRTVVNLIASKINLHKNRSGDFILAPTQRRQINVQQKHSSTNRRMLQPDDQNVTSSSQSPSPSLIITVDEQFDVLRQLCRSALDHYTQCTNKTELERRMENAFNQILSELDEVLPLYKEIQGFAHEYDYDVTHPYNGFRSFLYVIDKCMQHTTRITKYIDAHKTSLSFAIKRHQYVKEIEACSLLILNLCCCLEHLITLREWTKKGELFPSTPHTAKELLVRAHKIDQYSFYGRCLGFQFEKTMQAILKVILTSMAGFSKAFYYDGNVVTKTTVSFYNSGKYYFDAEARARRIVNVSQNAGVDFCKAFWFLAENRFMYSLPVIAGARVKINRVFQIPPEPLQTLCITTGQMLDVPVPSSHIGPGSVKARLISNVERVGMIGEHGNALKTKFSSPQQPSDYLIIHCHGGGFIACSSASHEVYLREWTIDLNVPIVSIDYSLAPKAPYPRALEEIYYAYCWAIKNSSLLGTTGKRIILAGDSAGANLILGCTMKCIETGIRRPDGIFMAYCPTLVDFVPSPARLLSLMDPLLPFGFMMQCLKAYSAPSLKIICDNKKKLEDTNSIKYAGRDESQNSFHKSKGKENLAPNSLVNGDGSISCLPDDDKFVQDLKKKYGSSDAKNEIPIHENIDEIRYNTNEDNVIIEVGKEMCEENMNVRRKLEQFRTSISAKVNHLAHPAKNQQKSPRPKRILQDLDALMEKSASEEFTFQVPNDPKLSPYHASDAELREMPPIKIVTTNLDPCLDDCIMYGKRLRLLGNPVDLDVLTGLPHGFLNFTLLSKEAHEGNKLCINRIKELMNNKKNK